MKKKKLLLLLSSTVSIVAPITAVMSVNVNTNSKKNVQNVSSNDKIAVTYNKATSHSGTYHDSYTLTSWVFIPTAMANQWRYHGGSWGSQFVNAAISNDKGVTATGVYGKALFSWINSSPFDDPWFQEDNITTKMIPHEVKYWLPQIYNHIGDKGVSLYFQITGIMASSPYGQDSVKIAIGYATN